MTFNRTPRVEIYRICLAKYAGELVASGNPGRWNLRGQLVICTTPQ